MVTYREANPSDYKKIAELHVISWQQHYRGNFSDHFLDVEASTEREGVWENRLKNPSPNQFIVISELDGEICGFACAFLDYDPLHGTLLDNLHVLGTAKGMGIDRHLMRLVVQEAVSNESNAKMYLSYKII
jgi:predicted N-acetyltransferase YhbS